MIEQRLRNALALDYPAHKLEIVVASDFVRKFRARLFGLYRHTVVRVPDAMEEVGSPDREIPLPPAANGAQGRAA